MAYSNKMVDSMIHSQFDAFKNMYDIDYIRSLNTSEEYFRYFPNYKGHTLILCSKYGIRSVK